MKKPKKAPPLSAPSHSCNAATRVVVSTFGVLSGPRGGEVAFTLVPNFLLTGILATLVGLLLIF